MRFETPRHEHYSLLDVGAWALVTVTTLIAIGLALIAVNAIVPAEMPLVGGAAAILVLALGLAALRHGDAITRAKQAELDVALAQGDENAARERLSFARHAAALMTEQPGDDGLSAVMEEFLLRFAAQAAAVVGDETIMVIAADVDEHEAVEAVKTLGAQTMKAGRSITLAVPRTGIVVGSAALTTPIRIQGELNHALVLWRRGHAFRTDDLDGLSLVTRIIELSMENAALVAEVRDQLSGTLQMMIGLVQDRVPGYGAHSERVAGYAAALGRHVGLDADAVEDLRTAGLLADVGMLAVPEAILHSPTRLTPEEMSELRGHPEHGADLTRAAAFPPRVQEAILSHHERMDGSGYPAGLAGDDIPLTGRILKVCDAYVALISDRPHRARVTSAEAIQVLRASAGTHYDAALVEGFIVTLTAGPVA